MVNPKWLSLEELVHAFSEFGNEADWHDIHNHVTLKRGHKYKPYKDWKNYSNSMFQIIQRHCRDYRKFSGIVHFEKVGSQPLRFRLIGYDSVSETDKQNEVPTTPRSKDLDEPPLRFESITYRILRDTALARQIKVLHGFRCQVCKSDPLQIGRDRYYAEIHHIKPLGLPHNGLDVKENILCVCPNCHVLLDYGAIKLDLNKLHSIPSHKIGKKYIQYHNSEICSRTI